MYTLQKTRIATTQVADRAVQVTSQASGSVHSGDWQPHGSFGVNDVMLL